MTESWRGLTVGGSPSMPRSSPPKRSFDVAFLTGIGDSSSPDEDSKDDSRLTLKIAKSHDKSETKSSPASPKSVDDVSSGSFPSGALKGSRKSSFGLDESNYGSAFTKVLRSQIPSPSPHSGGSSLEGVSSLAQSSWPPTSSSFTAMSTLLGGTKSLSPLIGSSSLLPHALAPLLGNPTTTTGVTESLNNNLVEEYLKSQHQMLTSKASPIRTDIAISTSEALSRLRSSMVPPTDSYKLPFAGLTYPLSGVSPATKLPSPFLPQPPVSALIPPTLATLTLQTQNVCAKCNISFRMTSDLVYHMRSQHKREPDLLKKRRNEKLKCPICGESFRERHHLTRHMTAHQDREEEAQTK